MSIIEICKCTGVSYLKSIEISDIVLVYHIRNNLFNRKTSSII